MLFYSTNNKELKSDLKQAVIHGLAADKGLFMPEEIPVLPDSFWTKLPELSLGEIGFETLKYYFCPDISEGDFRQLTADAFNFPSPVVSVSKRISSLELFHGPTLAFKDFGARFLARVMAHFTKDYNKDINVLVATSGDTGSAVANGFLGVKGVNVFVLYPKGLVSDVQEKQFTTLGQNITAIEVDGTFDDCQRLVKTAFMDDDLKQQLTLTSANSINLARFLPQMVYYFSAYAQAVKQGRKEMVVCVPSGNFGNLTAGLIAQQMGLPIKRFIAATNVNDVVPKYLSTGHYQPAPSIATPANAMDVGDPSNFIRIQKLFKHDLNQINALLSGIAINNDDIFSTIDKVYGTEGYILDPHGAVGYRALEKCLATGEHGIFLATAHPAKFPETVEKIINREVEQPERLVAFLNGDKQVESSSDKYEDVKQVILDKTL
ncbi:threonine synthase [Carboxylicivirga sp. A043]|uniref:threonine synthase n=1 Tax=Carboxylicivirga litoralis TaxID=2816963 RepID=UPI0021CAED79|nr:threonine synthase [Carboxylicivirga sp. A043]MCU4157250.1 threonine synthase [Carboxylicivirga sp. A043]